MSEGSVSVVAGVERLETSHGPLFAVIGVFDGIHVGHQYLLRHLVSDARRRGARAAVITFDSHPDEILVGAAPPLLVDPSERLRLLGEAGVGVVIVQHFDAAVLLGRPYSIVATAGEDGLLDVAMPVALPPAGEYRVSAQSIDGNRAGGCTLIVDRSGGISLEPGDVTPLGTRCRVAFQGS